MKKLYYSSTLVSSCLVYAQNKKIEKQLYQLWNHKTAIVFLDDENRATSELKKNVIDFYACMVKNYNENPKNYSEFMTIKELENKTKKKNNLNLQYTHSQK